MSNWHGVTAERRATQPESMIRARSDNGRPTDPLLVALAGLIRSAHENRRVRRATLTVVKDRDRE